mmetsp:Transcript_127019/g.206697  ORF Transcript_127019/g.206697 Transcript_127019/m.206697 type:complete len:108 (+) Transcript_127019:531-854(+)
MLKRIARFAENVLLKLAAGGEAFQFQGTERHPSFKVLVIDQLILAWDGSALFLMSIAFNSAIHLTQPAMARGEAEAALIAREVIVWVLGADHLMLCALARHIPAKNL